MTERATRSFSLLCDLVENHGLRDQRVLDHLRRHISIPAKNIGTAGQPDLTGLPLILYGPRPWKDTLS